ncbi:MAG TPA: FG-GAP-like repeat-containing protein [Pyrinomonadaceae bacterium]
MVDPLFNPEIQTNSFSNKQVYSITMLPDGKMLVVGNFNSYNRQPIGKLARLNADGTLDQTLNSAILAPTSQPGGIILQPDGKIVITGSNLRFSGQTSPGKQLVRLNADYTPDTAFNFTESAGSDIFAAAIDASGRLVLSGVFTSNRKVIRLNDDGSTDTSFQFVSASGSVERVATQNNKVIVALSLATPTIKRLNEDGTPDTSFTDSPLGNQLKKLVVQPDGKILLLEALAMQRLNENGGIDTSFTRVDFPSGVKSMALGSDGNIMVAQGISDVTPIKRFLSNGTPDVSFATFNATFFSTFTVQSNGGVIVGDSLNGSSGTSVPNYFLRIQPGGALDTTFNAGGIGWQTANPGSIRAIAAQPDGKIIVGGKFDAVNNSARFKIARLNADSTLDTSFQTNTSGAGNSFTQVVTIFHVALQTDGKIIVSGDFVYTLNGVTKRSVVRLNADGSIDSTFNTNVLINPYFACCNGAKNKPVILSGGKIMLAGSRRVAADPLAPVKLNADGTRDTTFNASIYAAYNLVDIYDLAIQPDGRIIIAGRYDTNGIRKSFVARLNKDGSTDQTFQITDEENKEISAIALLSNNQILVVKVNYAETNQPSSVVCLNSDGSPDNTFNAGTGANGRINALLVLPNGNLLVGGNFNAFGGQARQNLAKLTANGSLDSTTYNVNEEVLSLALDGEGRVLIGGNFTIIGSGNNLANRTYIARLLNLSQSGRARFDFDGDGRADLGVFTSSGNWSILNSRNNQATETHFGANGDKIAAADYDGDGKTDLAVYRPADGVWYLMQSTSGFAAIRWGAAEDQPVPADYDGDGKADVAVRRPSNGVWYILQSSNNQMKAASFGLASDIALTAADFDGDGRADIAVFRPSNGTFYWLASASGDQFRATQFGTNGDIPAVGDFNGDGKTDFVVFRPSDENWYQYLSSSNGAFIFAATKFGQNGDEPVAADYDGDAKTDIAVRRQGVWYLLLSNQGYTGATFGNSNAQAIAALPAVQ